MYGLPVGTDLGSLRGRRLDEVAVGYDLQLHFSDRASISIVGEFVVTSPDGERAAFDQPVPAAAILAERLSSGVVEAVVAEPGVVSLRFSDGYGLDIPTRPTATRATPSTWRGGSSSSDSPPHGRTLAHAAASAAVAMCGWDALDVRVSSLG